MPWQNRLQSRAKLWYGQAYSIPGLPSGEHYETPITIDVRNPDAVCSWTRSAAAEDNLRFGRQIEK